jgi:drug/metabolite transporter (DMT)-like permease
VPRRVLGLCLAVASGALFGALTLFAKMVDAHPLAKACVMAAGAGLALGPFLGGFRVRRPDRWKVGAMALSGGALAPALILYGLEGATALDAGLLLTLELVAAAVLAALFLREPIGWRGGAGIACLAVAGALAALAGGSKGASSLPGLVLVAVAALVWAVDNTVSAALTGSYRGHHLVAAKSLLALPLLAAAWAAAGLPTARAWPEGAALLALGALGVGLASVVHYGALRHAGAARAVAINVPVSAITSAAGGALLLGEPFGWLHGGAVLLVLAGMAILWERAANPAR